MRLGCKGPGIPGVQKYQGFVPTDRDDLAMWWRADKDAGANSWLDQVNGLDAAEATTPPTLVASVAALNNRPAYLYDWTNSEELVVADGSAIGITGDATFFWVVAGTAQTGFRYIFRGGTSTLSIIYHRATSNFTAFHDGTSQRNSGVDPGTGAAYWSLVLDSAGGSGQFYKNGAAHGSALTYDGNLDLNTAAAFTIGSANGSGFFDGHIAELGGISAALAGDDLAQLHGYMSGRYDL